MRAISRVLTAVRRPMSAARVCEQHHDLLERRVAGALADAVDRALDLAGAGAHAGKRVGDREAEVVVAVHRQHDVVQRRHQLVEARQPGAVLVRHRVADGVGDVDRARALLDRRGDDLGGELDLRARRVHRRELDVLDELARVRDGGARLPEHVLARRLQLVDDVDVGGRDERVDARPRGVADGVGGRVDVGELGAREPGDHRALDLRGRSPARPRSRPARRSGSRPRSRRRRAARAAGRSRASPRRSARCPATARRRAASCRRSVLGQLVVHVFLAPFGLSCGFFSAGFAARRPPRAIPPEGGGEEEARDSGNVMRAELRARGRASALSEDVDRAREDHADA